MKVETVGGVRVFRLPPVLSAMQRIFAKEHFKSYLVGGSVRDTLMGKEAHDYDVATDAAPQDVVRIFRRTIPTGIKHGTVTVRLMGESIETTTFRTEGKYTDGRHPDKWTKAVSIEDDLSRRDFTMNAIAVDMESGEVLDPFGGEKDIENRIIRAVGDAQERFMEDGLRPIRAIRFAAQTGFDIDEATYKAISEKDVIERAAAVSMERFRDEFLKIIACPFPRRALDMLEETGMRAAFLPCALDAASCSGAPCDETVRLAALLRNLDAAKARAVLTRLKLPNRTRDGVLHLTEHQTFRYGNWSDADVRRFVASVGRDNVEKVLSLRIACEGSEEARNEAASLRERIKKTDCSALSLDGLAVAGKDVIMAGVKAGPEVGRVLSLLLECVIDDPAMNTREALLEKVRAAKQGA